MELDSVITGIRVFFHLGIVALLLSYHPKGARYRGGVSTLAAVLAMCNAGLGVGLWSGAFEPRTFGSQWLNAGGWGAVFGIIIMCRGNLAKIVPKKAHHDPQVRH